MNRLLLALALVTALAAATTAGAGTTRACSAASLSAVLPQEKLPAAVAAMRQKMVNAAVACDYTRLAQLGNQGQKLTYTYGTPTSAAKYWQALEQRGGHPLATLVRLLRLPYTRTEVRWYAWPSAYRPNPTRHDWDLLVSGGILTRKEADTERKARNIYYGYRAAITPKGDWSFFVAGD